MNASKATKIKNEMRAIQYLNLEMMQIKYDSNILEDKQILNLINQFVIPMISGFEISGLYFYVTPLISTSDINLS